MKATFISFNLVQITSLYDMSDKIPLKNFLKDNNIGTVFDLEEENIEFL